jgi:hypothetical protein
MCPEGRRNLCTTPFAGGNPFWMIVKVVVEFQIYEMNSVYNVT